MSTQHVSRYPPTLVFTSVANFLAAVEARAIVEIGVATLQRVSPFAEGMLERRVSFVQMTARDPARDAILACAVYLRHGDFAGPDHLFTPPDAWRRQLERGDRIRRQLLTQLTRIPGLRLLDATYHVRPEVATRFASFPLHDEPE